MFSSTAGKLIKRMVIIISTVKQRGNWSWTRVARSLEIFSRTFCRCVVNWNFALCLLWIHFRYRGV